MLQVGQHFPTLTTGSTHAQHKLNSRAHDIVVTYSAHSYRSLHSRTATVQFYSIMPLPSTLTLAARPAPAGFFFINLRINALFAALPVGRMSAAILLCGCLRVNFLLKLCKIRVQLSTANTFCMPCFGVGIPHRCSWLMLWVSSVRHGQNVSCSEQDTFICDT